jgi:hypothetical protein
MWVVEMAWGVESEASDLHPPPPGTSRGAHRVLAQGGAHVVQVLARGRDGGLLRRGIAPSRVCRRGSHDGCCRLNWRTVCQGTPVRHQERLR